MPIISASSIDAIAAIRTGTLIDSLSGIGGFPRGRMTEIFGDEAVGKSTVCMQAIARAQQDGLSCLLADVEYSYTTRYGEGLGIDNEKLALIREPNAEDVLELVEEAVRSGKYDLVILDSIGGLGSRTEKEKSSGEKTIASQAGLIAPFCRKIIPLISIHNVALVVINHSFTDIMSGKILTSGGRKLAYHKKLSIRLRVNPTKVLKIGEERVGKVIIGEVKKNALAATEGRTEEAQLLFGRGFSAEAKLLEEAIDRGIITKTGNSYFIGETKLGVGLGQARKKLEEDAAIMEQVKALL
jgi:recombination protein RecA